MVFLAVAQVWTTVRPRIYGTASVLAFVLLVAIGFATISWRKRRFSQGRERPYRPPQGLNEMELHPFAKRPGVPGETPDEPPKEPPGPPESPQAD